MSSETLETLRQIDPAVLTEIVRQDQHSASFEIQDWDVERINHAAIIGTTGGLFRFSGQGYDVAGSRPWSVLLKIINNRKGYCQEPDEWCYWKREVLAFESGVLSGLPRAVRAPHSYGVEETDGGARVWMEYISEATDRVWSLEHYHRAARYSGRFAGSFLTGAVLPHRAWLTSFFRSIFTDGGRWALLMSPESSENAWQNQIVSQSFAEPLRSKVVRVWAEKYHLWDVLDRLPQVFCHNDFHRRNLMLATGEEGQEGFIAVDWAFCGIGAVGADMGGLVATSTYFYDVDPAQVADLEATVIDGYLAGLRDTGWTGDPRLARLGYLISSALWIGAALPGWAFFAARSENDAQVRYGRSSEATIAGWVTLCEFLMERADEARYLINALGLG